MNDKYEVVEADSTGSLGKINHRMQDLLASVNEATRRVTFVGERAFGGSPEMAQNGQQPAPPGVGEYGEAQATADALEAALKRLHDKIDRIASL